MAAARRRSRADGINSQPRGLIVEQLNVPLYKGLIHRDHNVLRLPILILPNLSPRFGSKIYNQGRLYETPQTPDFLLLCSCLRIATLFRTKFNIAGFPEALDIASATCTATVSTAVGNCTRSLCPAAGWTNNATTCARLTSIQNPDRTATPDLQASAEAVA